MLLNDINYDMYFGGDGPERPLLRRRSWAQRPSQAPVSGSGALAGTRRAVSGALIGLGQMIAPEPSAPSGRPQTATPSAR